jgi:hypothetical protein
MINDTSNQLVANAKSVMYENTLLFRAFAAKETMYMMVFEAIKDYSDYLNKIDNKEREKSIHKYTALKYIHKRGLQQFLEIITLMKNGFTDGAYSRWRSLYELNI